MKAITTQFHGPSNVRGSRYIASEPDGDMVIESNSHETRQGESELIASARLACKKGWTGVWVKGGLKKGNVWVCLPKGSTIDNTGNLRMFDAFEVFQVVGILAFSYKTL